ncbi:13200_t:CDS:2 [Acaulospora morrowiae]|uniref:13200_t:CDS:1 n=1 Tax=Acaulospora morrowiae TaxID=94023 RepID=A0A9N8V8L6_9GLOM|nr:13200_t:CDS:2 [Acaulospora morrowiae]
MNPGEKVYQLNALYKEYETVTDDLRTALLDFLPEIRQELNLNFNQVENLRQYLNDRGTLFRFLRRAGFDFDISLKELMADLRWRIENDVDTLSIEDAHPFFLEKGLFFFHKTDKFNRPCAIINLRKYIHEDGSPTIEEIKKFIIFVAEVGRRLLLDRNKKSRDEPTLQYVILLDLKGAGVSTLDIELAPFTVDIMRHHFPSSVGSIFVLNYGWMYSGIWQIFKRILPEETLNRIFFPSENEVFNYFDKENVLIEHGGSNDYEYELETCETFQRYGNPLPLLQIPTPLSRITSFDSLHDVFFSAHTTPYNSRPSTPFLSRPATPVSSRPASPGLDHMSVPNWLKMTPRVIPSTPNETRTNLVSPKPERSGSRHFLNAQFQFTAINPEGPASTSHNYHSHPKVFASPTDSTTQPSQVANERETSVHHVHFKDNETIQYNSNDSLKEYNQYRKTTTLRKPSVYRLLRIYTKLKVYSQRLLRRFIAQKITGVLSYLVMVVIFRGGLANEFWKLIIQQITMQLGLNSTNTATALSTAFNGRAGNRLLGL